jgi:ankyrin repeat protein
MVYAAASGHVNLIDPLRALGLGVNGSRQAPTTPLKSAAARGFLDCVNRLIELGSDLDMQTGIEEWNALHAATAYRRPLVAEKLVKAGADPPLRDTFGLSPLDYAIRDPQVWEKMGDTRKH